MTIFLHEVYNLIFYVFLGEDWKDSSHYLLNPVQLDLQLQKSLLPNDTRLPGYDNCQGHTHFIPI